MSFRTQRRNAGCIKILVDVFKYPSVKILPILFHEVLTKSDFVVSNND